MNPTTSVPINDLRRRVNRFRSDIEAAITEVLDSGWFINGAQLASWEREFGAYLGGSHVAGVGNGTDALELAMRSVGVQADDTVVLVANAGGYSAAAVHAIGARPTFVDIDERTLLVDVDSIASQVRPDTRAVVITHLYGQAVDVSAVRSAIPDHVKIVEDCAQAHGAIIRGSKTGTLGDVAAFSFFPSKNLGALGDGGAVTSLDADTASSVRRLRQYGWHSKYNVSQPGGRNSRLDELQAAVLRRMLPHLDSDNRKRRSILERYRAASESLRWVGESGEHTVAHLAVFRSLDRVRDQQILSDGGVGHDVHYPIPDHRQVAWADSAVQLPETEAACNSVITVPCFPEMTDLEVDQVAAALAQIQ